MTIVVSENHFLSGTVSGRSFSTATKIFTDLSTKNIHLMLPETDILAANHQSTTFHFPGKLHTRKRL